MLFESLTLLYEIYDIYIPPSPSPIIFLLFFIYLLLKKYIYSSRTPLLNTPIDKKLSIEILAIFICRMERVQNGCQSCNAFNKTIKSWQRFSGGDYDTERRQNRAVKSLQCAGVINPPRGGTFSNAITLLLLSLARN